MWGESYQWYKNGILINGATLKSLQLTAGSVSAGTYTVKVSNGAGTVTGGTFNYSPTANANNHDVVPIAGTNVAFSRYETTVGQWKAFVAETGWNKSDSWKNLLNHKDSQPFIQDDSHPVVSVSYNDASDYCQWLSSKTGLTWRLPTLEERNSAVGSVTYPWGENYPPTKLDGNYWDNGDGFSGTSPVGSFRPNKLGICDLGGNAWEWTSSGDSSGIAGGGYDNDTVTQAYCFVSAFLQNYAAESRNSAIGFRVVCELPKEISALHFASSTDVVAISNYTPSRDAITVEAIFMLDGQQSDNTRKDLYTENWAGQGSPAQKEFSVGVSGLGGFAAPNSNYNGGGIGFDVPISPHKWHHAAYVMSGTTESLYLDGQLVSSRNSYGFTIWASTAGYCTLGYGWIGYVSSFRISQTARYSGQSYPANYSKLSSDANTLLLYNFSKITNSTVVDESGNGRNGILGGSFFGSGAISSPTVTMLSANGN
jgi:formylglycine-generating enzyme required for sulfatase activity